MIELELRAGAVPCEMRERIMSYFRQQDFEELSFVEYLAYMPMFLNIHVRARRARGVAQHKWHHNLTIRPLCSQESIMDNPLTGG